MISITEINKNIQEAIRKTGKSLTCNMKECDYTSVFAVEFPNVLKKSGTLPHNIKFGGGFIHQSPIVRFASIHKQSGCELGDLLIFVRKTTIDGERFNAALVQLKRSKNSSVTITRDGDLKQLYLYEQWPCFSISQLGCQYNIFPKNSINGAVYGIIYEKKNNAVQFYTSEPMTSMQCRSEQTLGRFIGNMIDWQAGRVVSDEKSKDSDEWSRLIWDILRLVSHKIFNKDSIYSNQSKLTFNFLQQLLDNPLNANNNNAHSVGQNNNEEKNSGFGILLVDVDERERSLEQ